MAKAATLLVALLLIATTAWAAEIEGKIKSWDAATNMVTLDDGTQLEVPVDIQGQIQRDQLAEGANVKVSYEEKDGKKVVSSLEVTQQK
ncbi:MAG TPA: DUF1344 domain-containing protein [Methylomirabilota bacterium]|jgi:hypothetical protein|nr:DUF1344 domain-containing protein [Methylomirabilota bacterium]